MWFGKSCVQFYLVFLDVIAPQAWHLHSSEGMHNLDGSHNTLLCNVHSSFVHISQFSPQSPERSPAWPTRVQCVMYTKYDCGKSDGKVMERLNKSGPIVVLILRQSGMRLMHM
jgi:hypothetical protein